MWQFKSTGISTTDRNTICLLCFSLLFTPILGCGNSKTDDATAKSETAVASETENSSTFSTLDGTWQYVSETTSSGLTIVSEKFHSGTTMVLNAGQTAWIWSADTTTDGWQWISANAGDATEWASSSIGNTWTVTQEKSGEFSLWVQVKAANGIAWARTAIPASWRVVKDAAGVAWVWIDEHKVEIAVAAAVITVVAAGLIIAPEGVGPAVVKGAVAGTASEATAFLTAVWNQKESSEEGRSLNSISHDMFLSIGKSVLTQCGAQALGSIPLEAG
ncbi:MAG: hypothetical protein WAO83_25590 [Fuerstiella sp.]